MLKVAGDKKYLFASIGDKTRYFLAYDVADTKFHHNTDRLLELTKNAIGNCWIKQLDMANFDTKCKFA